MKGNIAVIGLGYVGLPLALNLSKYFKVIGFDKSEKRLEQLRQKIDCNQEISKKEFISKNILFHGLNDKINKKIDRFIVTVPTPVNKKNKPDIKNLISACKFISKKINKKNLVIIESTIAPETTEKVCLDVISKNSKIEKKDINICFSPERINPGDKSSQLRNLTKIVSGNSKHAIKESINIYKKITKNVVVASNIKSAELAKIIENAQRDLNISFMNEVYEICDLYNLDYRHILNLCRTKWNFVDFKPGLVGGHCVPVDPYYLIEGLKNKGFKSEILHTSRKINEKFVNYVFQKILIKLKKLNIKKIFYFGINFKDNVLDKRNSKYNEIFTRLKKKYPNKIILGDKINLNIKSFDVNKYDVFILGSKHDETNKLINLIYKKARTKKTIINIFGQINRKISKKVFILNI